MEDLVAAVGMARAAISPSGFALFVTQLFLRTLPGFASGRLRSRCYRLLGMDIQRDAFLMGNLTFRGGQNGHQRRLHIGANARISTDVTVNCDDHITIGDKVTIGPYVKIYTSTHKLGPGSERCLPEVVCKPVTIERGAWVALGVTILPGVRIGHGAVIGAGAVVTHDIPPDSYAEGVPAKVVRKLPFGNR